MSKKKSSGHKSSGHTTPAATRSPLTPSNNDNQGSLSGMEDIAHGESEGVPFILVDGVCVATRMQLDMALYRQETQRMTKTEKECEHLHQLECMNPPPELDALSTGTVAAAAAAMASLKAIEDELKFQADLQELCLPILEHKTDALHHPLTTPTGLSSSNENLESTISESVESQSRMLCQTTSSLDHIRAKLEELRQQQEKMLQVPSPECIERPSIRRQATFDIKRVSNDSPKTVNRLETIDSPTILQTPLEQCESSSMLGDTDVPSSLPKNSINYRESTPSPALTGEERSTVDLEMCCIVNQIGDLLMQLQQKREGQENFGKERSTYSYMVTIAPEAGVSHCTVEIMNISKLLTEKEHNYLLTDPRPNGASSARNSSITIFSPRLNNGFNSTILLGGSPNNISSESQEIGNESITNQVPQANRKSSEITVGLANPRIAATPKGSLRKSRTFHKKTNLELRK